MKLTLPPRVSAASFDQALAGFERVVGKGEWPGSAAVASTSVEAVRAIVRLANEFKTPLWPTSRVKNLGYGSSALELDVGCALSRAAADCSIG